MRFFSFLGLFVLAPLAACTHAAADRPTTTAPPDKTVIQTLAVTTKTCIRHTQTTEQFGVVGAALIASVGGALIDKGVDAIAAGVRKAGEGEAVTVEDKTTAFLHTPVVATKGFDLNPALGCLIVVHGPMSTAETPPDTIPFKQWGVSEAEKDDIRERLIDAHIPLAGDPSFYLEAVLDKSSAGVIRYRPVFLSYLQPIESNWLGRNKRSVVLTLAFGTPSADGGKTFATGIIPLIDLPIPMLSNNSAFLTAAATGWMPLASPDAVSAAALDKAVERSKQANSMEKEFERRLTLAQLLERHLRSWRQSQATENAKKRIPAAGALSSVEKDRILGEELEKLNNTPLPSAEAQRLSAWLQQANERAAQNAIVTAQTTKLALRSTAQQATIATLLDDKSGSNRAEHARQQLPDIIALDDAETRLKQMDSAETEATYANFLKNPAAFEAQLAQLRTPPDDNATPIVINVSLTETSAPSKVLLFIADVLDGAKAGVKQTLTSRLPKSDADKTKAEETATRADEALAETALTARQSYELAQVELADLPPTATATARKTAENKVALALFQARVAYRRAGLAADF